MGAQPLKNFKGGLGDAGRVNGKYINISCVVGNIREGAIGLGENEARVVEESGKKGKNVIFLAYTKRRILIVLHSQSRSLYRYSKSRGVI